MVSNDNISHENVGQQVRNRLLDAAERLFCEKGFEATNVRDLTAAAKCNIAAVNYHFGGKDKLYLEVFRRRMLIMRDLRIASIDKVMSQSGSQIGLEDLLRAFVTSFIEPLMSETGAICFSKLMAREMFDPHLPRSVMLDEMIIPVVSALQRALIKLCPDLDQKKAVLCIHSLIAQLIHTIRAREVFDKVDSDKLLTSDITGTVEHIVEFSAAGILAAAGKSQ
jgi:AcrR family transcriptional regulator